MSELLAITITVLGRVWTGAGTVPAALWNDAKPIHFRRTHRREHWRGPGRQPEIFGWTTTFHCRLVCGRQREGSGQEGCPPQAVWSADSHQSSMETRSLALHSVQRSRSISFVSFYWFTRGEVLHRNSVGSSIVFVWVLLVIFIIHDRFNAIWLILFFLCFKFFA